MIAYDMNSKRQKIGARGHRNEMGGRVQDSEIDMKRDAEGKEITWRGKQGGRSGEVYAS